jgi:hypothetical protein
MIAAYVTGLWKPSTGVAPRASSAQQHTQQQKEVPKVILAIATYTPLSPGSQTNSIPAVLKRLPGTALFFTM